MLSVFTPSHDPADLALVWEHLRRQTTADWEWVVVPNGPAPDRVRERVSWIVGEDARVRVVMAPKELTGVGALKRFACGECRGDVFVEVDHDDIIASDCLAKISTAVGSDASAFVYSDAATVGFDGSPQPFDPAHGWRTYPWELEGRRYNVNATPDAHPRSLCEIYYAPDHVRAWTRAAYEASGGHDAAMPVGDDHDLVVRTYLAGVLFKHIREPLYVHRIAEHTTSQKSLAEIAAASRKTRDKYLHDLVKEWCRRSNLPMLDLGGAHGCPPGYISIDKEITRSTGLTSIKCDVFDLKNLPDSSVGCFRASDFLEHIPPNRVVELMNLLYDKLVPGGFVLTNTPAVCDDEGRGGRGAHQDPTHASFWSSNNFWYYTDRKYADYVPKILCRFQTVRVANYYPSDWHRFHLIPYVLWDGMSLKDDDKHYLPGPKLI